MLRIYIPEGKVNSKMGKSKCAKSPISYLTTAPPEFETSKLLLEAVALAYTHSVIAVKW